MSDANSSTDNAVAISQRTVGVSFDLPSLEWNGPQLIDLKAASNHITDNLPKLALSTKRPSFDWLGNGPAAPSLSSRYPRLENTPQYLRCRRTLNDLQVTLDQGPLGFCIDSQRNRLVMVGSVMCIGNMCFFIVPPKNLSPSDNLYDSATFMSPGPRLAPLPAGAGSLLTWKLDRSPDKFQAAIGAGAFFAGISEQTAPEPVKPLGPLSFGMPGNSSQSRTPPPSIEPFQSPQDILSQLKPPTPTWVPDLTLGGYLKLTRDFGVTTQVSGNPVTGTASLAIQANLQFSQSLPTLRLLTALTFSKIGNQTKASGEIDFWLGLKELNVRPLPLNVGGALMITPGMRPAGGLGVKIDTP
jgi:hypothetical protein